MEATQTNQSDCGHTAFTETLNRLKELYPTFTYDDVKNLNIEVVKAIRIMNRPKARQREENSHEVWQTLRKCHRILSRISIEGGVI